MKLRLSIKNKLVMYFTILMVSGFFIYGYIAYKVYYKLAEPKIFSNLTRSVTDIADKISIILEQKQVLIEKVVALGELQDEHHTIDDKLNFLSKANEVLQFEDIVLVDLDGNSYGTGGYRRNIKGTVEFERACQGEVSFSSAILHEDVTYYTIAVPVKTSEGKVTGVLMGVQAAESFTYLLQKSGISDEIMILDSDAKVVFHTNDDILKNSMDMDEMQNRSEFADVHKLYEHMLQGRIGAMECISPETDKANYVAYSPIGMGWSIALVNYKESVLQDVIVLNKVFIGTTGLISILGMITVYFLAMRMSRRLSKINCCIDTVAQGNFDYSIPKELLELGDEMGDMARALEVMKGELEEMLDTIKTCTDYMNEQIEDLTEEVKEELKVVLTTEQIDKVERRKVIEQLGRLEQLSEQLQRFNTQDIKER